MNITEFRKRYPQYNDLSDQDLSDRLYAKYYSDMPKEDFLTKFGVKSSNQPEMVDTFLGKMPKPESFEQTFEPFKKELNSVAKRTPSDLAKDVVIGLGKTGQNIASTLTGGTAPQVNYEEMLNATNPSPLVQGMAGYLPFGLAGGPSLIGQTLAGGTFGATQAQPNESNLGGILPNGRLGSAIESAGLNALTHGVFKGADALRPSKLLRGNLTPEELQRNLDITQGTETGLGDVIGSPYLKKRYENTLPLIPFSGANNALQRTGNVVYKKGEALLNELLQNNSSENVPLQIADSLKKQFKKEEALKEAYYKEFNNEADKQFLDLKLKRFATKAKQYADSIESTNILKDEPDLRNVLKKLNIYKEPVKKTNDSEVILNQPVIGKKLNTYQLPTAKEASLLKGKLNEYAAEYKSSPKPRDRRISKIFRSLSIALKNDIDEAVKKSGNNKLDAAWRKAESNYSGKFAPYLDTSIYKYIIGDDAKNETIIRDFIKTSPNADLAAHLTKLSTKIPSKLKPLLAYSYFSRALDNEGNFNPAKLGTAISKLGKNQFKTLVPDQKMRQRLLDYNKLQDMNKEAQYVMFNPKTGQRNTDAIVTAALAGLGHILAGNHAALVAAFGPIVAGRLMTKYLTSPTVREALVKKMIENKPINYPTQPLQGLVQGYIDSNRNK